jgi:CO dehydrogenase/acetyl-CoA synthase beta subunit
MDGAMQNDNSCPCVICITSHIKVKEFQKTPTSDFESHNVQQMSLMDSDPGVSQFYGDLLCILQNFNPNFQEI